MNGQNDFGDREEIRATARAIKAQLADEFASRYGHITDSTDYFKRVADFTLEKMTLTAARVRQLELELKDLKRKIGV